MAFREIKVLLGWMEREEAVTQLMGRAPLANEDTSLQVQQWRLAKRRVSDRPEYSLATPTLEALPKSLTVLREKFLARADVQQAFQGWDYTVGIADLRKVLSFQKAVSTDAVNRLDGLDLTNCETLFSLCLPDLGSTPLSAITDLDWKGISFSSPNPNLRVMGGRSAIIDGVPFYGFAVGYGLPFVQIVEYDGRWFVRDGYHRCYALLTRNITKIPCLFIRAANIHQFGGVAPQFFMLDTLFGSRPPFLIDFLDNELSPIVKRCSTGKVIRIAAQEFSVQL